MSEMQARVERAVEELEAEGATVTARAVRERAGVRMSVAAEAARAWNEQRAATVEVPAIPQAVKTRMEALWREAVQTSRAELAAEREGLRLQAEAAHREVEDYRAEVKGLEDARDELAAQLTKAHEKLRQQIETAQEQAEVLRSRAYRAEAKLEAIEDERDGLLAERAALQKERDCLLTAARELPEANPDR